MIGGIIFLTLFVGICVYCYKTNFIDIRNKHKEYIEDNKRFEDFSKRTM